jgi:hypothetical protein
VEADWDAELTRRANEIRSGTIVGKPADQVFAELNGRYAEEYDPAFLASLAEARRQVERGETVSHSDLKREFGFD